MPADREISKLNVGDVITAINGVSVAGKNYYSFMTATYGGSSKEVEIRPVSSSRQASYRAWVETKRKQVEEYSNGQLGYLHIQGMNWPSFERFERELTAAGYGKKGIVIDVRYNGGGWTTDYLMAVLNVKAHAYTIPRGAANSLKDHKDFKNYYPSSRLPLASWKKPSIAICNETSYSNAEIFSHAYKHLGIGTLVGKATFEAVISTGGHGLIDGSFIRLPFRAWFVKATEENMELGPAVPDIAVENGPEEKGNGTDSQLKRSVEELLKQINE